MTSALPASAQRAFTWRAAVTVFLIAWFARGTYLVVATRAELFDGLFLDAHWYADRARELRFGSRAFFGGDQPYLLSPLYPIFLSLFPSMRLEPPLNPAIDVRLVQAAIGAITCAMASLTAARLAGSRAGWIAGVACALYPPLIYLDGEVLVSCLQALALTTGLALLVTAGRDRDLAPWSIAAGVAFGAASALRPTALVPLAALVLAELAVREGRRSARFLLGLVAGAALVIAPFAIHNVRAGEPLLLTAGGGFNFWVGNHAAAPGIFAAPAGYDVQWDPVGHSLAERQSGRELTYSEASRFFFAEARADIAENPGPWLARLGHKLWLFVHPDEIPQMGAGFAAHRERAWPLRAPLDARWVFLFAALCPLAVVLRDGRRALAPYRFPFAVTLAYGVTIVLFFVTARYRGPIMPTAIALAAITVDRGLRLLRRPGRDRKAVRIAAGFSAVCALVAAFAFRVPAAPFRSESIEARQRGIALNAAGRFDEAARVLSEALAREDNAKTRINLALALRGLGREDEARRELETVLQVAANDPDAAFQLGVLVWEVDRAADRAEVLFRRSITVRPEFADAHFNLGVVLLNARRFGDAAETLSNALALAPASTPWRADAERALTIARREGRLDTK